MYSEMISGLGVIASIVVAYHTAKYSFNSEIKKNKSLLISAYIRTKLQRKFISQNSRKLKEQ